MAIEIRAVVTPKDLRKFVDFPFTLYQGNRFWCPPLRFDEINTLSPKKNPAFEFCEAAYWIAYNGDRPVGRVAAIINREANLKWKDDLVRFGWIDFIDDIDVTRKLIETVSEWGKVRGMKGVHGPLGFCDMDYEGMLIEGFDELSALSAIYNFPYYPVHMEQLGFSKATDWVQFKIRVPDEVPAKVERMTSIVYEKYDLHLLNAQKAAGIRPYARKLFLMYNDAFRDLYGFTALTSRQMDAYTKQYFGFIRPEFVSLVLDSKDDVVGFGLTMPSLAKALQKCNGSLFPFGFLHLYRALHKNDTIHMYLVGVRPDYQGRGVLALVYHELTKAYIRAGIKTAITHPQLEENMKAVTIWKNYDARIHIRRRCWIKDI
jgi:hypothetical protein